MNEEALAPFAMNYQLVGPMMRELAQLSFDGKVQGVAEKKGTPAQSLEIGAWKVNVSLRPPAVRLRQQAAREPRARSAAPWSPSSATTNSWWPASIAASTSRRPAPRPQKQREYLRVEEGTYENGKFKFLRLWNGDQTDWGLNFTSAPQVLRVTLGSTSSIGQPLLTSGTWNCALDAVRPNALARGRFNTAHGYAHRGTRRTVER